MKIRPINIIALVFFGLNILLIILSLIFDIECIRDFTKKYSNFFSISLLISIIGFLILPLIFLNYKIIGTLKFKNSSIEIFKDNKLSQTYLFKDIKKIEYEFYNTATDGGRSVKLGINNYLVIYDKNDSTNNFRLLLKNQNILYYLKYELNQISKDFEIYNKRENIKKNK